MTALMLMSLACAPADTASSADTTLDGNIAPRLGDNPGQPAPDFVPYAFYLTGWTGLEEGEVVDPHPDATVTFTFWTEEGFLTGDSVESCAWTGHARVLNPALVVDAPEVWTASEVALDLVSTDCLAFPAEGWGEQTPTAALTTTPLALGHGPMSDHVHQLMTQHYDRHGLSWGAVSDQAFSTWLAVDMGAGFEGIEIGGALAYDAEAEAPLSPLDWTEELPDGVVFTTAVVPMGPAWIQ